LGGEVSGKYNCIDPCNSLITTHLPTQKEWKAELAYSWLTHIGQYSTIDRAQAGNVRRTKTDVLITEPRRLPTSDL